jgi:hypothetical protein
VRYFLILPLLCVPLAAEELVEPVVTAGGDNVMLQAILGIVSMLLMWGFKLLREKWKIQNQHEALDATKSLWEQRNFLIDNRIIPFAASTIEHWMITQMPGIIADATDGNGFKWENHWNNMKGYTRGRIIKKFASENIDLLQVLGTQELDNIIERLLARLIAQLPASVTRLLPDEVVQHASKLATEFLVRKGQEIIMPRLGTIVTIPRDQDAP